MISGHMNELILGIAHDAWIAVQDPDKAAEIAASPAMQENIEKFASDVPPDLAKKIMRSLKQAGIRK